MKKCPYCAEEIQDEAIICRYCKSSLITDANNPTPKVTRDNPLQKNLITTAVDFYIGIGYQITSQTKIGTQLIRKKKFSGWALFILALFWIIPALLYILYYIAKKDETIYITTNEAGKLKITDHDGNFEVIDKWEDFLPNKTKQMEDDGNQKKMWIALGLVVLAFVIIFLLISAQ